MLLYEIKLVGKIERFSTSSLHSFKRLDGWWYRKLFWIFVHKVWKDSFNKFGYYRITSSDPFDTLLETPNSIYTYIVNLEHKEKDDVIWSNLMGFKRFMADEIRDCCINNILD